MDQTNWSTPLSRVGQFYPMDLMYEAIKELRSVVEQIEGADTGLSKRVDVLEQNYNLLAQRFEMFEDDYNNFAASVNVKIDNLQRQVDTLNKTSELYWKMYEAYEDGSIPRYIKSMARNYPNYGVAQVKNITEMNVGVANAAFYGSTLRTMAAKMPVDQPNFEIIESECYYARSGKSGVLYLTMSQDPNKQYPDWIGTSTS